MGVGYEQLPNFTHATLTFERTFKNHKFRGLNHDQKKVRQLCGKMSTPTENPGYAYEKRVPPYVGMGPPEWLIHPCP